MDKTKQRWLLGVLLLAALAGCQAFQSYNPLSRARGLPQQSEARASEAE